MLTTIKVDADRKTLPKIAYREETDVGSLQFRIFDDPSKIYHILKLCVRHTLPPNVQPYTRKVGIVCKQIVSGAPGSQLNLHDKKLFTSLSSDYNNSVNKIYDITFSNGLDDDFFSLSDKDNYGITTDLGKISLIGGSSGSTRSGIDYINYEDESNVVSGLLYYIEEDL